MMALRLDSFEVFVAIVRCGGALGVALLGSLGTLIYRVQMQAVDVTGLDPAQAAAVKTTIGEAVDMAMLLRAEATPVWLAAARHSFSTGFTICCLLDAVTYLILAAVARRIYARSGIDQRAFAAAH